MKIKENIENWLFGLNRNESVNAWSLHNEFIMGHFFKNFKKSGKDKDLIVDLKDHLIDIDKTECPFEKEKKVKDLTFALKILIDE